MDSPLPKQVVVGSSPPPLLWRIGLLAGLLPTHALRRGRMSRAFALLMRLKMEKSASMRAHVLQIAGVIMPEYGRSGEAAEERSQASVRLHRVAASWSRADRIAVRRRSPGERRSQASAPSSPGPRYGTRAVLGRADIGGPFCNMCCTVPESGDGSGSVERSVLARKDGCPRSRRDYPRIPVQDPMAGISLRPRCGQRFVQLGRCAGRR
jgi:hypothetical protein